MSLDTRVIAALGAVVVVGAATVGGSVAFASGQTQHNTHRATLTVGNSSIVADPFCFNDGNPLSEEDQQKCQDSAAQALKDGTLPSSDVVVSDRVGVGVTPGVGDTGWLAFTNGGPQAQGGRYSLSAYAKGATYSGSQAAAKLLNASGKTLVTVVEGDKNLENPVAVWYFQLNTQDS
ncbi:hypothetical protein F7Q99_11020 [Streptomyces kaniharaensis]|uniref:DUF2771 domain-containing protein n=1 Tax=Streptomyces kaniharaensis TaxID=212423 RepID=A0A6N7KQG2_9ACTN|nr:hypothetical protein [Streptomyces kaniharaensis]MQS12809.1 hypothetical protein [Streptomyces kaniharaensis]